MTDYAYLDEDGDPLHQVVKRELQNGKKVYHQEHWDGEHWVKGGVPNEETVPYHLPHVLETIDRGEDAIWIVEGEKDASNGRMAYGICTTTNPGGAGKWKDHHSWFLRGAEEVYIVWDRDEKGAEHAWTVYDSLRRVGIPDIHFRRAKYGKDLSDHINEGGGLNDLVKKRPPKPAPKPAKEKKVQSDGELLPAAFQLALLKLQELGQVAIEDPDSHQYNSLCPAHDDSDPSLTIRPGSEDDSVAVLVHCFAGCEADAIATALGMRPEDFTKIEQQAETKLERKTEEQYFNILARQEAARRVSKQQNSIVIPKHTEDQTTGIEELTIPLEPTKWLVEGWFSYGTIMLLIADAKAGKTRLCMNLMQAITEGTKFLDHYKTEMPEAGKFCYLNYDMSPDEFRRYLKDYQWKQPERWLVRHLTAHQFPFWEKPVFDDFVEFALQMNIQVLVLDTMQMASQGFITDENSNTEVAAFISEVRKLKEAAAIPHVLIVHHRGRSKEEHGRGASSLDGAVSGTWTLINEDRESHDGPRTLRSRGRGVGQSPIKLVYNEAQELYTTDGTEARRGSGDLGVEVTFDKDAVRFATFCRNLKAWSDANDGRWPSATVAQRKLLPGDNNKSRVMLDEATRLGYVCLLVGPGKSHVVQLTDKGLGAVNADL